MKKMIEEALSFYNFGVCSATLIRHNENMTYKVISEKGSYVLRIHQSVEGFDKELLRSDIDPLELLQGEIKLLESLRRYSKIRVQEIQKNKQGQQITALKGNVYVTVLEWVQGETLEQIEITEQIAFNLGVMIREMHDASYKMPFFTRYRYDGTLMDKMIAEVFTGANKGHFTAMQAETLQKTLTRIRDYISSDPRINIMTHADLSKSNIILSTDGLTPIDFSLSGYSLPEMDIASMFSHLNSESLNQCVLAGYASIPGCPLDNAAIEYFLCLQILLFILCQHNKCANELWFGKKLDGWCEALFMPLIQ